MKIRPYADFYVRLLGGFSLYYRGREIAIGASLQNRSTQMLLMLLWAGSEGVERSDLLALVRPKEKDAGKRSNNLRQHLHILRRLIAQSGFPEGDYVILEDGRYYFSKTYQVETDVSHLDQVVKELEEGKRSPEEREDLYMRYCRAYTGELLPMLAGEEWVIVESAFYQKWYNICLKNICGHLQKEKKYETMLELCTTASQLHPYDEWQAVQIECLMAMDRYKEALEVYEEATEAFYKDLGPTTLDRVMEKYRDKDGQIRYGGDILEKIKQGLEEEETESPYCCSYPSFLDIYRITARIGERAGTESLLLLCTVLAGTRYGPSKETERCTEELEARRRRYIEKQMIQLKQVLREDLRIGDVYTRYSENQYLVLLIGAGTEDGKRIVARLDRHWERMGKGGRAKVRFAVQAVEGPGTERSEDGETRDVRCAYH